MAQGSRRALTVAVWLACLAPAAWLVRDGLTDNLTANPVERVTNTTGIWALRLIVATLAVTPLRRLTGWNALVRFRRPLGLFAFFYASLHFLTFFVLDHQLALDGLWDDVVKRPYITAGFTAFVLMVPLALTSTAGSIRRLGGRRWSLLHRLVYVTGVLAVLHYFWKVKLDRSAPAYYALAVAALLVARAANVARRGLRVARE